MFQLYLFCLIIGGVFVTLSALAGFDGVEFDNDFDTDVEVHDDGEHKSRKFRFPWLPFFTFRFWTFGSCFFGLTGVLLSLIQPNLSVPLITGISLGVGILLGTSLVSVLHSLKQNQANSLVKPDDLVGLLGVVELPFDKNSKGKIRLQVKESLVDFVALTEHSQGFQPGDRVLVVGMENNKVWVVPEESLRGYE